MADTINYQSPKPQFDIGRVINRTFGVIKNNFVNFFLVSLLIMGLPMFLIGLLPIFLGTGGMMDGGAVSQTYMTGMLTMTFLSLIVAMVGQIILQGALIYGSIADFNGEKASLGECLSVAIRKFFPLLGLAILVFICVMLGFMLLVIPGILIWLGWLIAAPVLIVEKKGITDSLSRSWELTAGYKRWILLLMVIMLVLSAVVGAALGIFLLIAGDPTTVMFEGASPTYHFLNAVITALSNTITTMIGATGVAAIYYEIRQIKEGIGAENLAAVFD